MHHWATRLSVELQRVADIAQDVRSRFWEQKRNQQIVANGMYQPPVALFRSRTRWPQTLERPRHRTHAQNAQKRIIIMNGMKGTKGWLPNQTLRRPLSPCLHVLLSRRAVASSLGCAQG